MHAGTCEVRIERLHRILRDKISSTYMASIRALELQLGCHRPMYLRFGVDAVYIHVNSKLLVGLVVFYS